MKCVLVGERRWIAMDRAVWTDLLRLAVQFGWTGRGTVRHPGWGGCYVHPCGQMIRAADAFALARALREGVLDVPDHELGADEVPDDPTLFERLGGRTRDLLLDVADLLETGAVLTHTRRSVSNS